MDGQNLFFAAKNAFGHHYPNYDIAALAASLCKTQGWQLEQVRFYSGIPDAADDAFWNHFWTAKMAQMGRQKIRVFSRPLRYRNQIIRLPDGQSHTFLVGQEKGVDVRLALDIVILNIDLREAREEKLRRIEKEVHPLALRAA